MSDIDSLCPVGYIYILGQNWAHNGLGETPLLQYHWSLSPHEMGGMSPRGSLLLEPHHLEVTLTSQIPLAHASDEPP